MSRHSCVGHTLAILYISPINYQRKCHLSNHWVITSLQHELPGNCIEATNSGMCKLENKVEVQIGDWEGM